MSRAQRLRARDPAASFLVQAPAGSGKTELLTQRILGLLAVVDEPEEILALTFTRKAAAEMRGRVLEALCMDAPQDAASHKLETWRLAQAALARSQQRGWHLQRYPARLRMMTLDSLTHSLAAQMPLLSGFGAMPSACSQPMPLYREAAEMAINGMIRCEPDMATAVLLHQDHNALALIQLLADMLARREQWRGEVAAYAHDMPGLRQQLECTLAGIMRQRLRHCAALLPPAARQELPALIAFAAANRGDECLSGLSAWPEDRLEELETWQLLAAELMTGKGLRKPGGINVGRGFPAGKEFSNQKQKFQQWLEQLAGIHGLEAALAGLMQLPTKAAFADAQWQVLEGLFSLLLAADARLQRLFAERGVADFVEIALRAMQALEDKSGHPTDLLLKLDYRIHHILVDEFQDTSLLQIRLLQALTAGWQQGDGRSLFMVGDPMQSIYRFRKAEVGLFLLAALNRAALPAVEKLTLARNFRSAPALVTWVNRAFAAIFPDEPDILLGAVGHAPAEAALTHAGRVCLYIRQTDDRLAEARAVVMAVQRELAVETPSGEAQRIAVLARSRKDLYVIMLQLSEAAIAFRAIDILPLYKRPEIRQMRALLRALAHPADRESWAALLRGPCCGLDSRSMYLLLAGDAHPPELLLSDGARLALLDAAAGQRIRHLMSALMPCLQAVGRVPVRQWLETAWHRIGMAALMDADSRRNIEAMLALIDELDDGGDVRFSLLDERLEKLYAAPDSSPEAARVELLTMHGSKGLQWDVVILPGLGRRSGNSDTPLLAFTDVPVAGGAQPLIAVRAAVRCDDAIYNLLRDVEKLREANEHARLLYVACTRAQTSLLMFGHVSAEKQQAMAGSLLKVLLPDGLGGDCFGAELIVCDETDQGEYEEHKRLQRIAALPELPGERVAEDEEEAEVEAEYFWAGAEAAPIGSAVHAALQMMAGRGIEHWSDEDQAALPIRMRRLLTGEGLSGGLLEKALADVLQGVERVTTSSRGRWLLSGTHRDAHAEWSLVCGMGGHVRTRIIDRSFIDDQDVRWIIDYKTGTHEGADLARFLAQERRRYRTQLQEYAEMVGRYDGQRYTVRLALYFPMLDAWDEWEAGG